MSKSYFNNYNIEGVEEGVSFKNKHTRDTYYLRIDDIYVEPGVKTVTLGLPTQSRLDKNLIFELSESLRQFPDVETLIISSQVYNIVVSNFMFPNVKRIQSNTPRFVDNSNVLISRVYYNRTELLNTFCKQPGERIDITDVDLISNYAFEGCRSTEIIYNKNRRYNITKTTVKGYIDNIRLARNNVAELCGTIIRIGDADKNFEFIESQDEPKKRFINDLSFENIKKLTIHKSDILTQLLSLPPVLEIKETDYTSSNCLTTLIESSNNGNLENVIINNEFYKTVDDVIYSKDGRTLVFCSPSKRGTFKIPDNVKHIESFAFENSHLETIEIPSGIKTIGAKAFSFCSELKHLKFEKGIQILGSPSNESIISDCNNLDIIEIPESVVYIKDGAFMQYKGTVILNDGIQSIGRNTFSNVNNKTISLPESLVEIQQGNFLNTIIFNMPSLIMGLISGIIRNGYCLSYKNLKDTVVTLNIGEKRFYFPRYLSANEDNNVEKYIYLDQPEKLLCLYELISDSVIKQKTAIELYELTKSDAVKTYLRRSGNSIINNLIDDIDSMIKLLSFNILTEKALKKALDIAQKKNIAEITAYILKSMDETDNSKNSFRL